MNIEDRLQKEMTRHMQELDAIQNSKSTEQDTSKVDKFINEMREMNTTVSGDSKEEINSTYYSTLVNNGH